MPKTDPRPIPITVVGVLTLTITPAYNGLVVTAVEGGSVTRAGVTLGATAVLATGDVLIFTPTTTGGTVTLLCNKALQEFSGLYADLSGAPSGGGGGGAGLALADVNVAGINAYSDPDTTFNLYAQPGIQFTASSAGSATGLKMLLRAGVLMFDGLIFIWRNGTIIPIPGQFAAATGMREITARFGATVTWAAGDVLTIALRGNGGNSNVGFEFASTEFSEGTNPVYINAPGVDVSVPMRRVLTVSNSGGNWVFTTDEPPDNLKPILMLIERDESAGMLDPRSMPVTRAIPAMGEPFGTFVADPGFGVTPLLAFQAQAETNPYLWLPTLVVDVNGQLPLAPRRGQQAYHTGYGVPIWWDGTVWKFADGAALP